MAIVTALVVFLGGVLVGRATKRARAAAICSCKHGFGTHAETGQCNGVDRVRLNGITVERNCRCMRYDGPQPIGSVWIPPVLGQ
jgi:hypothetical protein